jgi:hypothetical protein
MVVVLPTRELSVQTVGEVKRLLGVDKGADHVVQLVAGGRFALEHRDQAKRIVTSPPHILVGSVRLRSEPAV